MSDNDIVIIVGLLFFFIAMGLIAPALNEEFGASQSNFDPSNIENSANIDAQNYSPLSGWKIFLSVITMPFYTFGNLPVWVEWLIFFPIRIGFWFLVIRQAWPGGGA